MSFKVIKYLIKGGVYLIDEDKQKGQPKLPFCFCLIKLSYQ